MDEEIPSSPNACNESQIRRKLVNSETKYVMRRKRTANDPAKKKTFQQTLQRTSQSADLQESSTPSASGLVASVNLSVSLINNEVSGSDQNRRQNESSTLYHQHSHPTNTEDLFNSDSTKTECFYTANIDPESSSRKNQEIDQDIIEIEDDVNTDELFHSQNTQSKTKLTQAAETAASQNTLLFQVNTQLMNLMDMKTSEVPSTSFRKPQTPKIVKTPQNPQTLVESEGGMGLDTQAFVQKEFERMLEPSQACVIQFEEENDGTLVQKSGNEDLATLTQQVQSVSELELQENSQIGKNVSMLSQLYTSDDKIDVETTELTKPKDLLDPDENFQFTISEELKNILDSPTYPLETIHDASNILKKKSSVDGSGESSSKALRISISDEEDDIWKQSEVPAKRTNILLEFQELVEPTLGGNFSGFTKPKIRNIQKLAEKPANSSRNGENSNKAQRISISDEEYNIWKQSEVPAKRKNILLEFQELVEPLGGNFPGFTRPQIQISPEIQRIAKKSATIEEEERKNALENFHKLQQKAEEEFKKHQSNPKAAFVGFSSARGNVVAVDEEKMLEAKKKFESVDMEVQSEFKNGFGGLKEWNEKKNPSPAPGKRKNIFEGIDLNDNSLGGFSGFAVSKISKIPTNQEKPEVKATSGGFSTARGANIIVSDANLKFANQKLNMVDLEVQNEFKSGFGALKEWNQKKNIENSTVQEAIEETNIWKQSEVPAKRKNMLQDFQDMVGPTLGNINNFSGFKSLKAPSETPKPALVDKETDEEYRKYMELFFKQPQETKENLNRLPVNEKNISMSVDLEVQKPSTSSVKRKLPDHIESPGDSLKKQKIEDDPETPIRSTQKRPNTPVTDFMRRFSRDLTNRTSTPLHSQALKLEEEDLALSSIMDAIDTSALAASSNSKKLPRRTKLVDRFNSHSDSIMPPDIVELIKEARKNEFDIQTMILAAKPAERKRSQMGSYTKKKMTQKRKTMREFVKFERPGNLMRHDVDFEDAKTFSFEMSDYLDEYDCATNTRGLSVEESVNVVINPESLVTFQEVRLAFLLMVGVDPSLVSEAWIANAYHMIILKLVHLENSFVAFEKFEILSPLNVIHQLKYRYDKEIDGAKRPILRKIVEMDDVACKRMVLKVIAIAKDIFGEPEPILSDGWYWIRCTLDEPLKRAVEFSKLKIGDKIITSGAQIVNCEDGKDILALPENVRLVLHGNSTRRTLWDMKLGLFVKHVSPLPVSLNSVKAGGGLIGQLTLYVVHQHPMLYFQNTESSKVFRSERLETRLRNAEQNAFYDMKQTLLEKIMIQFDKEQLLLQKAKPPRRVNFKQVEDPGELCDLFEFCLDPESVEMELTNCQLESLHRERERRLQLRNDEIVRRVSLQTKQMFYQRNVSQVLRIRVVDAKNPTKTALLSIWHPSEDIQDLVKPGNFIQVSGASASKMDFEKELTISSSKMTIIKKIQRSLDLQKFQPFLRVLTPFSAFKDSSFAPLHNEFDIICLVVHIGEKPVNPRDSKPFQQVHVADTQGNLLSILFWYELQEMALTDVVVVGQVLLVKNLQWRTFDKTATIQSGYNADYTHFVNRPKGPEVEQFMHALDQKNKLAYVKECEAKIEAEQLRKTSRNKENITLTRSLNNTSRNISNISNTSVNRSIPVNPPVTTPNNKSFPSNGNSAAKFLSANRNRMSASTSGPNTRQQTLRNSENTGPNNKMNLSKGFKAPTKLE